MSSPYQVTNAYYLSSAYAQFSTYFKVLSSLSIKQFLLYYNQNDLFYILYSQSLEGVELFELIINKAAITDSGTTLTIINMTANNLMQELLLLSNLESRTLQAVIDDNQLYINNTFNSLLN